MHRLGFSAALAAVAWLATPAAQALYIDDYTVSTTFTNVVTDSSLELGPIEDLGLFNRQLALNGAGGTGASIVIDGSAQTATFTANGQPTPSGRIIYTPTAGTIDLSAAGTTLDFIFNGVTSGGALALYETSVVVSDATLSHTEVISTSSSPRAPGPLSLPLSDFSAGVAVDAITEIRLEFLAGAGQQIRFSAPAAAPAPATLALLAAGVGLLSLRGRRL